LRCSRDACNNQEATRAQQALATYAADGSAGPRGGLLRPAVSICWSSPKMRPHAVAISSGSCRSGQNQQLPDRIVDIAFPAQKQIIPTKPSRQYRKPRILFAARAAEKTPCFGWESVAHSIRKILRGSCVLFGIGRTHGQDCACRTVVSESRRNWLRVILDTTRPTRSIYLGRAYKRARRSVGLCLPIKPAAGNAVRAAALLGTVCATEATRLFSQHVATRSRRDT